MRTPPRNGATHTPGARTHSAENPATFSSAQPYPPHTGIGAGRTPQCEAEPLRRVVGRDQFTSCPPEVHPPGESTQSRMTDHRIDRTR